MAGQLAVLGLTRDGIERSLFELSVHLSCEFPGERVGLFTNLSLESPPQHVRAAAAAARELPFKRLDLVAAGTGLLGKPGRVHQHLHAPLFAAGEQLECAEERGSLARQHVAYAFVRLVQRAQPQRDDGALLERSLEHRLVCPRHPL